MGYGLDNKSTEVVYSLRGIPTMDGVCIRNVPNQHVTIRTSCGTTMTPVAKTCSTYELVVQMIILVVGFTEKLYRKIDMYLLLIRSIFGSSK